MAISMGFHELIGSEIVFENAEVRVTFRVPVAATAMSSGGVNDIRG